MLSGSASDVYVQPDSDLGVARSILLATARKPADKHADGEGEHYVPKQLDEKVVHCFS
jgi:hypothetical protein